MIAAAAAPCDTATKQRHRPWPARLRSWLWRIRSSSSSSSDRDSSNDARRASSSSSLRVIATPTVKNDNSSTTTPRQRMTFVPPPGPPPCLDAGQLKHLVSNGWLNLQSTFPQHLLDQYERLFDLAREFFGSTCDGEEEDDNDTHKRTAFPSLSPKEPTESGYFKIKGEKEYITFRCRRPTPPPPPPPPPQSTVPGNTEEERETAPSILPVPGSSAVRVSSSEQSEALPESLLISDIEESVEEIWRETARVLERILHDVSRSFNFHPRCWAGLVDGALTLPPSPSPQLKLAAVNPSSSSIINRGNAELTSDRQLPQPSMLRVFSYEPDKGVADRHSDLGLLTVCVCCGEGLQVLSSSTFKKARSEGASTKVHHRDEDLENGRQETVPSLLLDDDNHNNRDGGGDATWTPAPRVTLLVGDTLRILSANRIKAAPHRVVGNPRGRQSIVFALRPSLGHDIDERHFGVGTGIVSSSKFWHAIKHGRVNVNAQREERERVARMAKTKAKAKADAHARLKEGSRRATAELGG